MKRQRDMAQMKEQIKTPEKELNEMEISNLSDAEFKILFIRMLEELSEDLNSIKNIQSEMKDTLIEIKNNLQRNNNRVNKAEKQNNDIEHKEGINNKSGQEEKRIQKNEDSISSLWDKFKCSYICIMGCQKEKRKDKKWEICLKKR